MLPTFALIAQTPNTKPRDDLLNQLAITLTNPGRPGKLGNVEYNLKSLCLFDNTDLKKEQSSRVNFFGGDKRLIFTPRG